MKINQKLLFYIQLTDLFDRKILNQQLVLIVLNIECGISNLNQWIVKKFFFQYLEQLRQVIGLRSYGQRDPLVEYKKEAFDLFSNLLEKLKLDFVTILMNLKVVTEQQEEKKESIVDQIKSGKKIGRNEPCPCGSGKKFKHCCGAL